LSRRPQVGEQAPDFELQGTDGRFKLSDHRGERVVLLFYPGDFTPVCTQQFCSYRDRADDLASLGATMVGISAQDLDSHERFSAENKLEVPLLADVEQHVAQAYSVKSDKWSTDRSVIVIDEQGIVRYRHDPETPLGFQSVDDLKAALDAVPAPS
jgi:thioredoxin-dependent peroxiredoxin